MATKQKQAKLEAEVKALKDTNDLWMSLAEKLLTAWEEAEEPASSLTPAIEALSAMLIEQRGNS